MMPPQPVPWGKVLVPNRDPVHGKRVQLMITCLCDAFFDDAAQAALQCLERAGCEVQCPRDQTCCGQAAYTAGDWAAYRQVVRHVARVFDDPAPVVSVENNQLWPTCFMIPMGLDPTSGLFAGESNHSNSLKICQ